MNIKTAELYHRFTKDAFLEYVQNDCSFGHVCDIWITMCMPHWLLFLRLDVLMQSWVCNRSFSACQLLLWNIGFPDEQLWQAPRHAACVTVAVPAKWSHPTLWVTSAAIVSFAVLRSRKKVPCLVGDVDARVITLSTHYIPPEPITVRCLNQPKALVYNECYLYQHVSAEWLEDWKGHRKVRWTGKKLNSWR
jgi:hypothetical protein